MNRDRRRCVVAFCCAVFVSAGVGCSSGADLAGDTTSSSLAAQSNTPARPPSGTQGQLPLTTDGVAASVAATDKGVYVADTGYGSEVTTSGFSSVGGVGRLLLVEPGAAEQQELPAKVGIPVGIGAASDGTIFVATREPNAVVELSSGSTQPHTLPFTFDDTFGHGPDQIAVSPDGYAIVLTNDGLQLLPKGGQTPKAIADPWLEALLGTDDKGAVYFSKSGFDNSIYVLDSGATEPRVFEAEDDTDPTRQPVALAFDTNGDRYTVYESCGPDQEEGTIRPCKTLVYTLTKVAAGSSTPSDIPVDGLTSATSVAVDELTIYIADGKRVVTITK